MKQRTHKVVSARTIRDAVESNKEFPAFQLNSQNAIDKLVMADAGVDASEVPFSEENYKSLLKHFGLPYNNSGIFALSLVLALKFVPKFDGGNRKPGRPEEWKPFHYALLYSWIEMKIRVNARLSVTSVCEKVPDLQGHLPSQNDLRGRYYKAKKINILSEYNQNNCAVFGNEWPKQFADGKLEAEYNLDPDWFDVLPSLRRATTPRVGS